MAAAASPDVDIPRYIRLMQADKCDLDGLVTYEFPLERINDAIGVVRRGEAGRVLVAMEWCAVSTQVIHA